MTYWHSNWNTNKNHHLLDIDKRQVSLEWLQWILRAEHLACILQKEYMHHHTIEIKKKKATNDAMCARVAQRHTCFAFFFYLPLQWIDDSNETLWIVSGCGCLFLSNKIGISSSNDSGQSLSWCVVNVEDLLSASPDAICIEWLNKMCYQIDICTTAFFFFFNVHKWLNSKQKKFF